MITALKRLPGNTIEATLTLPWSDIEKTYLEILTTLLAEIEVPGFRRGKAPREMALKQINESRVYEEVLKKIVPELYQKLLKQENLKPVISPKIELLEAEKGKDWKIRLATCEKPTVTLGNYRGVISKVAQSKKNKIWVQGQKKEEPKDQELTLGELLDALYQEIKVELSEILIEQEVNRVLSRLINETQRLGMTVEQYLKAQEKTSEQLRKEYQEDARKTLSLEFALEEIADQEKVTVESTEIDKYIENAKTPQEREVLTRERYYLGSLLRRQKTLQNLLKTGVNVVKS